MIWSEYQLSYYRLLNEQINQFISSQKYFIRLHLENENVFKKILDLKSIKCSQD